MGKIFSFALCLDCVFDKALSLDDDMTEEISLNGYLALWNEVSEKGGAVFFRFRKWRFLVTILSSTPHPPSHLILSRRRNIITLKVNTTPAKVIKQSSY